MATLESATERLEEALKKLEGEVDRAARARSSANGDGAAEADANSIESLRRQYDDLNAAYESMRTRYESMREKNRSLAARLDETIARLRRIDGASSGS